jgi:hypothetical protein
MKSNIHEFKIQKRKNMSKKKILLLAITTCLMLSVSHAANYYWVGGSGNWSDVTHWATTSGGSTFYTTPPTINDDVFFDASSFTTGITNNILFDQAHAYCRNFNCPTPNADVVFGYTSFLSLPQPRNVHITGHFELTYGTVFTTTVAAPSPMVFVNWIFEGANGSGINIDADSDLYRCVFEGSTTFNSVFNFNGYFFSTESINLKRGILIINLIVCENFYTSGTDQVSVQGNTSVISPTLSCRNFIGNNGNISAMFNLRVETENFDMNVPFSNAFTIHEIKLSPYLFGAPLSYRAIDLSPNGSTIINIENLILDPIAGGPVSQYIIKGNIRINGWFYSFLNPSFEKILINEGTLRMAGIASGFFGFENDPVISSVYGKIIREFGVVCFDNSLFNNITGEGNVYLFPSCTATGTSAGLIQGAATTCPAPIVIVEVGIVQPTCAIATNGSATMGFTGGNAPYTFEWRNSAGVLIGTTETLNNVAAGSYTFRVIDSEGISNLANVSITPSLVNPMSSTSPATIFSCPARPVTISIQCDNMTALNVFTPSTGSLNIFFPTPTHSYDYTYTPTVSEPIIFSASTAIYGCEYVLSRNISLTASCIVAPPTPAPVSGNSLQACAGTTEIYSVPQGTQTEYYVWTPPAGATVNGYASGSSISITLPQNFTSGILKVKACNYLGCSAERTRTIYSKPLSTGTISGAVTGVCALSTQTYSTTPAQGAISYKWFVPAGAQIVSGQSTTSILVSFPQGFVSGTVSVYGSNNCGNGPTRRITVRSAPAKPGSITGKANDLCQNINVTYSIANVAGASSYNWSVPAFATIISGQGTTSITVNFPKFYATATISVVAVNNCGNSEARSLIINPFIVLLANAINGPSTACANQSGLLFNTTAIPSATYYDWTLPPGGVITSGITTNSITANWSTVFTNMSLRVQNSCGASNRVFKTLVEAGCRNAVDDTDDKPIESMEVFPNPATDFVQIKTTGNGIVELRNSLGQALMQAEIINGIALINLKEIKPGVYFVIAICNEQKITKRMVVTK